MNMKWEYRKPADIDTLSQTLTTYAAKLRDVAETMREKQIEQIYCSHALAFETITANVKGFHAAIDGAVSMYPNNRPRDRKELDAMQKEKKSLRIKAKSRK